MRLSCLLPAAAILLANCGGPESGETAGTVSPPAAAGMSGETTVIDPCLLITAEDIAALLPGRTFLIEDQTSRPGGKDQGSMGSCSYAADTSHIPPENFREALDAIETAVIIVWTWPDAAATDAYVQSFVESGMGGVEPLSGPGDRAIRLDGPAGGVTFRKGLTSATVSLNSKKTSPAEDREIELQLAGLLAGKL